MHKRSYPINEYEVGVARTIKAQYQQTSLANIARLNGTYAATGVITYYYDDKKSNNDA